MRRLVCAGWVGLIDAVDFALINRSAVCTDVGRACRGRGAGPGRGYCEYPGSGYCEYGRGPRLPGSRCRTSTMSGSAPVGLRAAAAASARPVGALRQ